MAAIPMHRAVSPMRLQNRATFAAKNALIVSALDFGSHPGVERAVLFAVAEIYAIVARTPERGARLDSRTVDDTDGDTLHRQLAKAESDLCLAATALSRFGRRAVQRLMRASLVYTEAAELRRSWAARNSDSATAKRIERLKAEPDGDAGSRPRSLRRTSNSERPGRARLAF